MLNYPHAQKVIDRKREIASIEMEKDLWINTNTELPKFTPPKQKKEWSAGWSNFFRQALP